MNKKIILATVATIAAVGTAQGVYADEVQGTTGTGSETSGVTAPNSGKFGEEKNETASTVEQPTVENSNAEAGSKSNDHNQSGNATEFTKNGSDIQVTNPEVVVDQSNGTGKYQGFTVEYKNVHFPDEMEINEGDKVKFTLPEEVKFQTNFDFDVYNPEKQVVGKATTDTATNTVTTVFNNYFKDHPLNKQMSLKLDATWTDKVESGKPVNVNFNGTVVTANIGKEQVIGKDELLAKWGSQDKDDPTVINWTARVNYAKRVLNYVTIIDEMSENQKLVDDFFEIKSIESVNPWIDKGSAMDLVKSISKSEHGFTIKMDRLDRMIYVNYSMHLNSINQRSILRDIPMMPPAPILEKPELIIDIPDPKPQPKTDKLTTINSKPSKTTVEPQKEQVNVIYQQTETNAHTLPNTGSESGLVLSFAGMFILGGMARIALKREGE